MLRELEAGLLKVDILISGSGGMVSRLKPAKALQPLRPMMRPEILDAKNWLNGEPVWVDRDKEYVLMGDLTVGVPGLVNPSVGEDEIKSWDDLLKPKFDGKIISLDPRGAGQSFAFSAVIHSLPDLGPDYLYKFFKGGRIVFTPDQRQAVEWVDTGRMLIAFGIQETEVVAALDLGAKFRTLPALMAGGVPQTIVFGAESALSVPNLNPLPHPNAAKVYANWIFSKQGQQAMIDSVGQFSVRLDVDQSKVVDRLKQKPGVRYTNANSEDLAGAEASKAMRDVVTKAIADR